MLISPFLLCMCWAVAGLDCDVMNGETVSTNTATSLTGHCWDGSSKHVVSIPSGNGIVTLERCGFYSINSGSSDGGAVATSGVGVTFLLCEFKDVTTSEVGGGFCVRTSPVISVDSCLFEHVGEGAWRGGVFYATPTADLDVRNSQFVQLLKVTDGSLCYCEQTTPSNFTFENCTFSCNQSETLTSGFYCAFNNKDVPITVRDCVFNCDASFSSYLFYFKSKGDIVFEQDTFNGIGTDKSLMTGFNAAWKTLQVLGCDFQNVTTPCPAIDTQDIVSVVIDNCSFENCNSTAGEEEETQGGVVVIGAETTQFTISTCRFIANSCTKGVHSLHILSSSAFNLTNCTFSGHVGSLPVLKAETPAASLLSSDEFALVDCVFEENALDGKTTGIVTFPQDKAVRIERCSFVDNKASVTQTQCTKIVYDSCFFNVSLDDSYCPPIGDYGTPAIEIISCSFAHYGATGDDSDPVYVEITGENCQVNVSDACFGSGETNAISGGNVTQSGSQFGADCQPPWAPPPEISESQEIEDPDDFPLAAVVGGVVGAVVVIVIIVVIVVLLTRRKKVSSTSTDHETILTS